MRLKRLMTLTLRTVLFISMRLSMTSSWPSCMSFWSTIRNTPTNLGKENQHLSVINNTWTGLATIERTSLFAC